MIFNGSVAFNFPFYIKLQEGKVEKEHYLMPYN